MNPAKLLFDDLLNVKNGSSQSQAHQIFIEFCRSNLGTIERLHFDFKEKQDNASPTLGDSDRKNLAKAVSGFANSGGGVLVWGVEDATLEPKPIVSIDQFVSSILQYCHQITSPAVLGVDGFSITDAQSPGVQSAW